MKTNFMRNPPPIGFTIILLLILLIPYTSRLFHIEPFPAVIMPSGHGRLNVSENKVLNLEYEIKAFSGTTRIPVSMKELFPSTPEQYYIPIIHNNFGFSLNADAHPLFRNFNYKTTKDSNSSEEKTSLIYFYEKSFSQEVDSLVLKVFQVERAIDTRQITKKELFYQNSYLLN